MFACGLQKTGLPTAISSILHFEDETATVIDPDELLRRIVDHAGRLPDATASVRDDMRSQGLEHGAVERLHDRVSARAAKCSLSPTLG